MEKPRKFGKFNSDAFKGKHKELAGFTCTYDASTRADQYERTTDYTVECLKKDCVFPKDIGKCMLSLTDPDTDVWMPKPRKINEEEKNNPELTEMMKQLKNEEIKQYMKRIQMLDHNKCNAYALIQGQCSPLLRAKLKGQDDWETIKENSETVLLLKSIKVWMMNHQDCNYQIMSTLNIVHAVLNMYQYRHETLEDFRTRFETAIEVVAHIVVDFAKCLTKLTNSIIKESDCAVATKDQIETAEKKAYEKFQAVMFLKAADKSCYEAILTQLDNLYSGGLDQYPENITEAYNVLNNWKREAGNNETPYNDGIKYIVYNKLMSGMC